MKINVLLKTGDFGVKYYFYPAIEQINDFTRESSFLPGE